MGMWCIWDVQVEEGLPLETCDTLHNNVSYVGMWCVGMWFVGMWYMWDVQVEEGLPLETCDTLHNNGAWGYTADHTPRPVDQVGMEGCVCIYCNTLQHTPTHSNAR